MKAKPGGIVVSFGQWMLKWVDDEGDGMGIEAGDEEEGDVGVNVMCFVKSNVLVVDRYGERCGWMSR